MKKILLFVILVVYGLNCYSQIKFEKGYYINNSDEKINCYIKNYDWGSSPESLEFKLLENSELLIKSIKDVKEFRLNDGQGFYIRKTVNIDLSNNRMDRLSHTKAPIFRKKQIFLKKIVTGKASLYSYQDSNTKLFFFSKNDLLIEPLIYKRYLNKDDKLATNTSYRQQLINALSSDVITKKEISKVQYDKEELTTIFIDYNTSQSDTFEMVEKKSKGDFFNMNIRSGLNFATANINPNVPKRYGELNFNDLNVKFGLETEIIIPATNNKLGMVLEVIYQSSNFDVTKNINTADYIDGQLIPDQGPRTYTIDYSTIELPIGVRYYFNMNKKTKFFVNGAFVFNRIINAAIQIEPDSLTVKSDTNISMGLGCNFYNKFSAEINYQTPRSLTGNSYSFFATSYNSLSLMLGYTIL